MCLFRLLLFAKNSSSCWQIMGSVSVGPIYIYFLIFIYLFFWCLKFHNDPFFFFVLILFFCYYEWRFVTVYQWPAITLVFPGVHGFVNTAWRLQFFFPSYLPSLFPTRKLLFLPPFLQEFLVKLSSERGREPIAGRKKKTRKKEWVEVVQKMSMQILSGVKYKIIGC